MTVELLLCSWITGLDDDIQWSELFLLRVYLVHISYKSLESRRNRRFRKNRKYIENIEDLEKKGNWR